ncbi:hypothetical protein QJQ45_021696 [Haematococcus lacustris]|nr:hypothetical protein QJQ45_021696 [Haematococcus lacustris]
MHKHGSDPHLQVFFDLEQAVHDLSSRALHTAARWAAEQLNGLDASVLQCAAAFISAGTAGTVQLGAQERHPLFMLARQHMEFKVVYSTALPVPCYATCMVLHELLSEYYRAATVLSEVPGPKALFLRCYSRYLAGEKRREEEVLEQGPGQGKAAGGGTGAAGREGAGLPGTLQGPGGALQRLVTDAQSLNALPATAGQLPTHWATDYFLASACLELQDKKADLLLVLLLLLLLLLFLVLLLHPAAAAAVLPLMQENSEALSRLQRLSQTIPGSLGLEAALAQAHYNLQNFDEAQAVFEDLMERDPYRLEGMDTYSNILFVKEMRAELSSLAHRAMLTDKYRPETCCIVGNYYSLKGQHEKAVEYFRRALKLQRTYLAAWTLMGHEFMELKNTAAAIEAYRQAVDLAASDFRAWYGLGQAYELLRMPYYALYYYRRTHVVCFGTMLLQRAASAPEPQVANYELAIRCYQRALEGNDPDGIALHSLAKLHQQRGDQEAAEQLYRTNLARLDQYASMQVAGGAWAATGDGLGEGAPGQPGGGPSAGPPVMGVDAVAALLFLAERCKDTGRLAEAQSFCERLLDLGGPHKEKAKALAREVHAMQAQQRVVSQQQAQARQLQAQLELEQQQQLQTRQAQAQQQQLQQQQHLSQASAQHQQQQHLGQATAQQQQQQLGQGLAQQQAQTMQQMREQMMQRHAAHIQAMQQQRQHQRPGVVQNTTQHSSGLEQYQQHPLSQQYTPHTQVTPSVHSSEAQQQQGGVYFAREGGHFASPSPQPPSLSALGPAATPAASWGVDRGSAAQTSPASLNTAMDMAITPVPAPTPVAFTFASAGRGDESGINSPLTPATLTTEAAEASPELGSGSVTAVIGATPGSVSMSMGTMATPTPGGASSYEHVDVTATPVLYTGYGHRSEATPDGHAFEDTPHI